MDSRRILIVDDEKNMRTTLQDILSAEGYDVDAADCGEKAVKMFERRPYDLVLLDVRMPGMDGLEAFRILKRTRASANVVLMSAYSMEQVRRQVLDEGASAFVRKPLDVESLLQLIRGTKELTVLTVGARPLLPDPLVERLRREGTKVLSARIAGQALELVRQIHFDVIFLDEADCPEGERDLSAALKEAAPSSRIVLVGAAPSEPPAFPGPIARLSVDAVILEPIRTDEVLALLSRIRNGRATEPA